ncbi:MAG: YncE family protein [Hyphomicrobiaceae bacterium]
MSRTALRVMALGLACSLSAVALGTAQAQLAVSANDGRMKLNDGKTTHDKAGVDSVTLIDLAASPPKAVGEIKVPASVAGPPTSVAVTPNEEIALVTAAQQPDPADPSKQVPADILTVIELNKTGGVVGNIAARIRGKQAPPAYAPKVLATLKVGLGAAGVTINRAGTLALVANRNEGTVSVLTIAGKTVTVLPDKIKLGDDKSGPSGIVIAPDGRSALVTMDGEGANKIAVLEIDGTKVTYTKRDINAGLRPYGIDIDAKGEMAVVANIGRGQGDLDTISVIDLRLKPSRVVNTVTVGQTPEGIKISPDGNYVAISVMNGTNKPSDSPFFAAKGKLIILRRSGTQLTKVAEADVGRWCQGIVWSTNSKRVFVQCMVEQQVMGYSWNASKLAPIGNITTTGGPAGIRTVEK